ncbi:MAG: ArsC/Spx/MgsR family protein [Flavobacteriaceae bacterium]|nr:ArsC/Spx/MgsR family protein [Flavobacteriaceae bacterium]
MKKIYYLSTCSTCKKLIDSINTNGFEMIDIKKTPLSEEELEKLKQLSGSFESLFSKRAKLYTSLGLKNQELTESDFKKYLLMDYTFLKRPVIVDDKEIFIGSSAATQEKLVERYQ